MNKKLILLPIVMFLLTLTIPPVAGQGEVIPVDRQLIMPDVQTRELDPRAKILASYFAKYNSPLENQAQDFIDAADTYGVDWKLVPAIAGVESTFGKNSYGYNAWGWGIYGNQSLNFGSWRDGIFTVTGGLKENYINKGLTEPYAMNRIYATSPVWGGKVTHFINDLDNFAGKQGGDTPITNPLTKVAASSAQLASQ